MKLLVAAALASTLACEVVQQRLTTSSLKGRFLDLSFSLLDECLKLSKVANVLTIEKPGSLLPSDVDFWQVFSEFCSEECTPNTSLAHSQCVRPVAELYVTVFDLSLEIDLLTIQGKEQEALYEFAFRLGSALGIPIEEISTALLWSNDESTEVKMWKIGRIGLTRRLRRRLAPQHRRSSQVGSAFLAIHIETRRGITAWCDFGQVDWSKLLGVTTRILSSDIMPHQQEVSLDGYSLSLKLLTKGTALGDSWRISTVKQCSSCNTGSIHDSELRCGGTLVMEKSYLLQCDAELDTGDDMEVMTVKVEVVVGDFYQAMGLASHLAIMTKKALTRVIFGTFGGPDEYFLKRILAHALFSNMPADPDDVVVVHMLFVVLLNGADLTSDDSGYRKLKKFAEGEHTNGLGGELDHKMWAEFPLEGTPFFSSWVADFYRFNLEKQDMTIYPPLLLACPYNVNSDRYTCICPVLEKQYCPTRHILSSEIPSSPLFTIAPDPGVVAPLECSSSGLQTECRCVQEPYCRWVETECVSGSPGELPCTRCPLADLCRDDCMNYSDKCTCMDHDECAWTDQSDMCVTSPGFAGSVACEVCAHCVINLIEQDSASTARKKKCAHCIPPEKRQVLPTIVAGDVQRPTFVVTFSKLIRSVMKPPSFCAQVECGSVEKALLTMRNSCKVTGSTLIISNINLPIDRPSPRNQQCVLTVFPFVMDMNGNESTELIRHSFYVRDGVAPQVMGTEPKYGYIATAKSLKITFDEPVRVIGVIDVDNHPKIQAVEDPGDTSYVTQDDLHILEGTKLGINLRSFNLRGNVMYAIDVPEGVLEDMAGNGFTGFTDQEFVFVWPSQNVDNVQTINKDTVESGEMGDDIQLGLILVAAALVFASVSAGVVFLYRFTRSRIRRLEHQQMTPKKSTKIAPGKNAPWAQHRPIVEDFGDLGGSYTRGKNAQLGRVQNTDAKKTTTPRRRSDPGASLPPDGPRTSQRNVNREGDRTPPLKAQQRDKTPPRGTNMNGNQTTKTSPHRDTTPPPGSSRRASCPNFGNGRTTADVPSRSFINVPLNGLARDVACQIEQNLRHCMSDSQESRKKLIKGLLVEYHPDKNDKGHAKEVFQFVNANKSWFLQDL
eukprot:GEMP01003145.1.p1 GENE.GEMP01003145.1~~GEMP01003145.1.p1  ORF type:complete len:1117 (+),score=236.67 GEMP01003145.1:16-3366(+)